MFSSSPLPALLLPCLTHCSNCAGPFYPTPELPGTLLAALAPCHLHATSSSRAYIAAAGAATTTSTTVATASSRQQFVSDIPQYFDITQTESTILGVVGVALVRVLYASPVVSPCGPCPTSLLAQLPCERICIHSAIIIIFHLQVPPLINQSRALALSLCEDRISFGKPPCKNRGQVKVIQYKVKWRAEYI